MKMALSLAHSLTTASTRWGGANVPAFIRTIRFTIAVIVLALVCIPVCMFTFVVGLPLVLGFCISDWWSQVRSESATYYQGKLVD